MTFRWLGSAAAAVSLMTTPAAAAVWKLDVTADARAASDWSFPYFTFTNLSSAAEVSQLGLSNGPPWDWIDTAGMVMPSGATRTLLEGEERNNSDGNNGCTAGIGYGFTGFGSGEAFGFAADPESGGCGTAVVDVRSFLAGDDLTVTVAFAGGPTLSGSDWTLELIDPSGSASDASNQRYRLTLQAGVPEPATWALMILGFGSAGAALRRRRHAAAALG